MKKIESLTPAQIERMAEYRDKWIAIGLSTEPAARSRAEEAIRLSYRLGGIPEPKKIIWCGSPLSQGLTRAIILDKKLRDNVGDSVRASVWASVGASVRDSVRDSIYGSHDAGWLSFYAYFNEVVGLKPQTEKLAGLWQLAQSAGWVLPHQEICWISERHHVLSRDEQGRLHSLSGPSVAYPDGWKIYAVHGVRVPEYIIERPHEITTRKIDTENNAEIRRVMVERYGTDRYVMDSGAKPIHADKYGTLYRKDMANDEPIVLVKVLNSTPEPDGHFKSYFLRVPPDIQTAHAAVAWTFGRKPEEYQPLFES